MSQMSQSVKSNLITYPHGFSTRIGGVSEGVFDSLNLGMNLNDDKEKVIKNWSIFLKCCGMKNKDFVCGKQIHENNVAIVTKENAKPAFGQPKLIEADGYVTKEKGVPLAIFTADCTPLLLADEINGVIAAVHCGWRSSVSDIMKNAVDAMISIGADVNYIKASMGPAIQKCCFEVGKEVVDECIRLIGELPQELCSDSKNEGKYMLDLKGVIRVRLLQLGLKDENIEILNECTMCNQTKYWSHRGTKGVRGSQANIIMISE